MGIKSVIEQVGENKPYPKLMRSRSSGNVAMFKSLSDGMYIAANQSLLMEPVLQKDVLKFEDFNDILTLQNK